MAPSLLLEYLAVTNFASFLFVFNAMAAKLCKEQQISFGNSAKYSDFIHRIHKWRKCGKKLVPSHESEALEDKQKLQMKTFSELAECLARIPPKITLYGRLFKYNYVGRLLLLMFSSDLLFAIKTDAYIFKETG